MPVEADITGEWTPDDSLLSFSGDLDAEWRMNSPALHLDPKTQSVWVPGGEEIKYDGMIIATGVDARAMGGAPRHDPRVHVLRTLDDAVAIRKNIRQSQGLVAVIGGGFIGCELACSIRHMGRDVALIVRSPALLGGVVGDDIGKKITEAHVDHGVRLATGVGIKHWVRQPGGIGIHLSDGQVFFASCVVLAVGASPAVDWLRGSGLDIEDGVLCDATNHVVGAENIVACGDVARWPNMRFNGAVRRVEHWLNAVEGGRAAAENLLVGRNHAKAVHAGPAVLDRAVRHARPGCRPARPGHRHHGRQRTDRLHRRRQARRHRGPGTPGKIITETPELFRQNTVEENRTVWTQPQPAEETKSPPSGSPAHHRDPGSRTGRRPRIIRSPVRLVVDVPAIAAAEAFTFEAGDGASGRRTREALTRSGGYWLAGTGQAGTANSDVVAWPGGGPMTSRGDALVPAPAG